MFEMLAEDREWQCRSTVRWKHIPYVGTRPTYYVQHIIITAWNLHRVPKS